MPSSVHVLALSLQLAGFAPPQLPPDEPVATTATQPAVPEPDASLVPEPDASPVPDPTPPPVVGSVAIIIVGTLDPDVLATAVAGRLASLGISPSFSTASDFSPQLVAAPADRIADIWVLVSTSELRVVVSDPAHTHTLVRTLPIDAPLEPASLADSTAPLIEEGVTTAMSGAWPASVPLPPVEVEQPVSPVPIEPDPEPARPARGRYLRGLFVGVSGGAAYVRDELHNVALGIPVLIRLGYLFGHNRRRPDLRASIEARVGSMSVPHSATKLALLQVMAESRIGFTRGPVWMFGIVGIGSGAYRRIHGDSVWDSNGIMGTLGLGASVRITRYLAIHCDGVASGHPDLVGRLGFDLGLTGYIDVSRKGRGR